MAILYGWRCDIAEAYEPFNMSIAYISTNLYVHSCLTFNYVLGNPSRCLIFPHSPFLGTSIDHHIISVLPMVHWIDCRHFRRYRLPSSARPWRCACSMSGTGKSRAFQWKRSDTWSLISIQVCISRGEASSQAFTVNYPYTPNTRVFSMKCHSSGGVQASKVASCLPCMTSCL